VATPRLARLRIEAQPTTALNEKLVSRRPKMNPTQSSRPRGRNWKRWTLPTTAAGAGGMAVVLWFEEMMILALELVGVIFMLILAIPIFLFNHLVFKSAMFKPEDKNDQPKI
jgi:hypothetical protein